MAPEILSGLSFTTRRAWRRFQHIVRRAEKKEAKRLRAERGKNGRPFIRRMLVGRIIIRVGNDIEIYEPEAVRLAGEEMEEINLFYEELDEEDYDAQAKRYSDFL